MMISVKRKKEEEEVKKDHILTAALSVSISYAHSLFYTCLEFISPVIFYYFLLPIKHPYSKRKRKVHAVIITAFNVVVVSY